MYGKPLKAAIHGTFCILADDLCEFEEIAKESAIDYKLKTPATLQGIGEVIRMKRSDFLFINNQLGS